MSKTLEKGSLVQQGSELVIPAVPGEFYAYTAEFTDERSVYALLKCKSNKARPRAAARELGSEANLFFIFGDPNRVQICTVKMAQSFGFVDDGAQGSSFGETWIAAAGITVEQFRELCSHKDADSLVKICQAACTGCETSLSIQASVVIAVMTAGGKYGLFYVKEFTPASLQIDACHILL